MFFVLDFSPGDWYNQEVIRSSTQAGRRGVTRNLVGHESVARVRIPAAPPKNLHPIRGGDFLMKKVDSKGRPDRREGKKVSSGHFFVRGRIHSLMNAPGTGVGRRLSNAAQKQNKSAPRWRSHRRGAKRPVDTFFVRGWIHRLLPSRGIYTVDRYPPAGDIFSAPDSCNSN